MFALFVFALLCAFLLALFLAPSSAPARAARRARSRVPPRGGRRRPDVEAMLAGVLSPVRLARGVAAFVRVALARPPAPVFAG